MRLARLAPSLCALAVLVSALLGGCAGAPAVPREAVWIPTDDWWAGAIKSGATLASPDGRTFEVKAAHARNLHEVAARLRAQGAMQARLALADSDEFNAYAASGEGGRVVTLTLALLEAIGNDRDALATTLGHEMAHLYYAHGEARRERTLPAHSIAYVYGLVVEPGGMTLGGQTGTFAVNASFTRYEEREADLKGMEWAVEAGFSPCGAARTMRILTRVANPANVSALLSTHPGHDERIARAHAMQKKLTGSACLIL
jgi:predicted Zn-dependent protease